MTRLPLLTKTGIAVAAMMACFAALPEEAAACPYEAYIGSVCYMATDYCPEGYLPADGRSLPVQQYQALYSLLGIVYGGNGTTSFNIPDLRGRVPVGTGLGDPRSSSAPLTRVTRGQYFGTESVTLDHSNTPTNPHTHAAQFTPVGGKGSGPLTASGPVTLPVTGTVNGQTSSGDTGLKSTTDATIASSSPSVTATGSTGVPTGPGTISGTATGTVTLPVTGETGITGGTVTVAANPAQPAAMPVAVRNPGVGMTACIAANGIYPMKPQ